MNVGDAAMATPALSSAYIAQPPPGPIVMAYTADSDSDSDVLMAADSDESDDDSDRFSGAAIAHPSVKQLQASVGADARSSSTRNPSGAAAGGSHRPTSRDRSSVTAQEVSKSGLSTSAGCLPLDRSLLPLEIWHRIFAFTPPKDLGHLLQVNKLFNAQLDPCSPHVTAASSSPPLSSAVLSRHAEAIWHASRKLFLPQAPSPLAELSELAMWRLARGWRCHYCDKSSSPYYQTPPDEWHTGPGTDGVAPIWMFGIRACGSCLQKHTVKEIDLLMSSSMPAELMAALPFVLLSSDLHVLSPSSVRNGRTPPNVQFAKCFYKPHIERIRSEFFKVKSMGAATLDEWMKGLEERGREERHDAGRWEKWHTNGGLSKLDSAGFAITSKPTQDGRPPSRLSSNGLAFNTYPYSNDGAPSYPHSTTRMSPQHYHSPAQPPFAPQSYTLQPLKQERTKEEAIKRKAARRQEIERRCMLLDPPIRLNVLVHTESFQAAVQIGTPFTDVDWENLKPRLLAQREAAEAEAARHDARGQDSDTLVSQGYEDLQANEAKELADWEEVQIPIREQIIELANEIIESEQWAGGANVTKDNSARFAVDVLLHVRKRFYTQAKSPPTPESLSSQKLVLENMKWTYDTLVKPYTEKYRKELFLCNGCDNGKLYALEGVVQHYAAKHTSTLSCGNVVVHWKKAEWPAEPPFHPNPAVGQASHYSNPVPLSTAGYFPGAEPPAFGPGGYQPEPQHPGNQPPYAPVFYSNGYQDYGTQSYPYPDAPASYPPAAHAYQPPGPQFPQPPYPYRNGQEYAPEGYGPAYPGYESAAPYQPGQPQYYPNYPPGQVAPGFYGPPLSTEQQERQAYKAQLDDVARNARDVWNKTAGVKELPGSVRVFTIIHHLVQRSRASFPSDPPLAMVIDGLSNNRDMRPVRNVNELTCRTCSLDSEAETTHGGPVSTKKSFSLPQLFNHFQTAHIGVNQAMSRHGVVAPPPDWIKDMVELPDLATVASLASVPGMDDTKLQLIREAIPEAFRLQPKREVRREDQRTLRSRQDDARSYYDREPSPSMTESAPRHHHNNQHRDELARRGRQSLRQDSMGRRPAYRAPAYEDEQFMSTQRARPFRDAAPRSTSAGFDTRDLEARPPTRQDRREPPSSHVLAVDRSRSLTRHRPDRIETISRGSEEGELHASGEPEPSRRFAPAYAAENADRFLNSLLPDPSRTNRPSIQEAASAGDYPSRGEQHRRRYIQDRENIRGMVESPHGASPQRSQHDSPGPRAVTPAGYVRERQSRQPLVSYDHERYVSPAPELLDRRYGKPTIVYREERPGRSSHTPSRFARYEQARLEIERERARSRSPVFVKVATRSYRERSPPRPPPREPHYDPRFPADDMEEVQYERIPRQEYYRMYPDEPRPRPMPVEERCEYVRVADGPDVFYVRRPVRDVREPPALTYDESHYRLPADARPSVSRADPAYYEEYDPRHPEPPPLAMRHPR